MKTSSTQIPRGYVRLAVGTAGIVAVAALVAFFIHTSVESAMPLEKNGIPLPFGGDAVSASSLKGSVSYYGKRNNIDVYEVGFSDADRESLLPDRIYLVHIPNDARIATGPIDNVMRKLSNSTTSVDYYGYKYSDAAATLERRDIYAARFADRFPAQFFASQAARDSDASHGGMLARFEQENGVRFLKTDGSEGTPRIDGAGSLFVFVVNESGGAMMSPREAAVCGNGRPEGAETCDDGNSNNADSCKNNCTIGLPIPFGDEGGTTPSPTLLAIAMQPMPSEAHLTVGSSDTVPVMRFQVGTSNQNITINRFNIAAVEGSFASLGSVKLWRDTNGDNTADTEVGTLVREGQAPVTSGYFDIALDIELEASMLFEVRASPSSTTDGFVELGFQDNPVVARDAAQQVLVGTKRNGQCPVSACAIALNTVRQTRLTVSPIAATVPSLVATMRQAPASGTLTHGQSSPVLAADFRDATAPTVVRSVVFKVVTGSPEQYRFSLWADTTQGGELEHILVDPVVDAAAKTVTFTHAAELFSVSPQQSMGVELRAEPLPSAGGELKVTFALSAPRYIDAWAGTPEALRRLVGIATNGSCAELLCDIAVTERPTTVFNIPFIDPPEPPCGNGRIDTGEQCDDGGIAVGDGCNASCQRDAGYTCTGEPSVCVVDQTEEESGYPVSIAVDALPATGSATPGTDGLTFLRFTVRAGSRPVRLNGVMFDAAEGSLASLDLNTFGLWRDTNGDGTADTRVLTKSSNSTASILVFFSSTASADREIAPGQTAVFEVRGGFKPDAGSASARLKFALSLGNFVIAKNASTGEDFTGLRADGICFGICDIDVATRPSTLWTVAPPLEEPVPECGNSVLDAGEECDDGNADDETCDRTCHLTVPVPNF